MDAEGNKYKTFSSDEAKQRRNMAGKGGSFVKGKLYGQGDIIFKNGNVYDGNLKGSKRDGKGKMTYLISETEDKNDVGEYEGNWIRDQRYGEGTMKYEDGSIFKGTWKNSKL